MAKVDYVKINNTIKYIQNVAYLSELPVANENSADFVSVNNELYVKQVNGTTYTYAKVGGSGGTEVIEKTIDPNGGEPLVFTEDFTQEEFDKLLNGSALLQIWTMADVLSYILKPYAIQKNESMNAYAIRLSCLADIESGNHLYMLLIKRDGVITYQIENVGIAIGGGATIIEKETTSNAETGMPNFNALTFSSEELTKMQEDNVVLKIVVPDASSVMFFNKTQNYGATPTFYYTFSMVVGGQEIMLMVIDNNGSSTVMPTITQLGGSGSLKVVNISEVLEDNVPFSITKERYEEIASADIVSLQMDDGVNAFAYKHTKINIEGAADGVNFTMIPTTISNQDEVVVGISTFNITAVYYSYNNTYSLIKNAYDFEPMPVMVEITNVPNTATSGTLTTSQLETLQKNDQNYIVFNNEIFKLADKQHNEGYLVYSHNGHDTTGCFFQKCITITLSTRGWVLEEQENASKTYVSKQITSAYGFDVSVVGDKLVFETVGDALQGDY